MMKCLPNLNILLRNIAENPNLTANLQELDFSFNFMNQASVGLLTEILTGNQNIVIEAVNSIPEGVNLGNLVNHPRFDHDLELQVPVNQFTPSTSPSGSRASSLDSGSNDNQL